MVSISRSAFYYQQAGETLLNVALMRLIDEAFLEAPWYGSRQMARHLRRQGHEVGRMRVRLRRGLRLNTDQGSQFTSPPRGLWENPGSALSGARPG